jgi:hypothetical protein
VKIKLNGDKFQGHIELTGYSGNPNKNEWTAWQFKIEINKIEILEQDEYNKN